MGVMASQLRLYLVTDPELCASYGIVDTVRDAVRGGATMIQLRDKTGDAAERIAVGRALLAALEGTGVPLIVNDDIEAARAIGAHGVHVGQSDCAPAMVRAQLGPDAIVGLSCETLAHVIDADPSVIDYVGIGPVFATATKPDHAAAMGLNALAEARAATRLPAVAIGGIHLPNVAAVLATGVDGVAVVSAICGQTDPFTATVALARTIAESVSPSNRAYA